MTVARGNINTYLIIGKSFTERESYFRQSFSPGRLGLDLFVLEVLEKHKSVGLGQILDLQKTINLKAWGDKRQKVFAPRAELLTEEAQNCLLKILEEPPKGVVFILSAPTINHLLPTVVSRCFIVDLRTVGRNNGPQTDDQTETIISLINRSGGERLLWVEDHPESYQNRDRLIELLDSFTVYLRKLLLIDHGLLTSGDESKLSERSDQIINLRLPESDQSNRDSGSLLLKIHSVTIVQAIDSLMETKKIVTETNASPRLALEVFLLDLPIVQD